MNEENNNNNEKNNNGDSGGGFNNYWIYIAIAAVLLGINFLFGSMSEMTSNDLKYPDFSEALRNQQVEKLVVVNQKLVQVYLNDKAKEVPKFKETFTESSTLSRNRANFTFELGGEINFLEEVKDIQADGDLKESDWIYPEFETQTDVIGPLIGWIFPVLIIIALWLFIKYRKIKSNAF